MIDDEIIAALRDGWTMVFQQGVLIAHMPIEDWLEAFHRAETLGPVMDPTLFREYLSNGKGEVIKDVLRAALTFKRAIKEAQNKVENDRRLQSVG